MASVQGTFTLKSGDSPSKVWVSWKLQGGTATKPEERTLQLNGKDATPDDFMAAFEDAGDAKKMAALGTALWECIAKGNAGQQWSADNDAIPAGELMRTILDGTDLSPEWQSLPWEIVSKGTGHLTIVAQQPFVRLVEHKPGVLTNGWPTRILIVCGEAPDTSDDKINVRNELEAIEDGMWERRREIIYRVLDRPEPLEWRAAMQKFQPHVLHFIGHGNGKALIITRRPEAGQNGNEAPKWEADAGQIRSWVNNGNSPTPFLVFLNACGSGIDEDWEPMSHESFRSLTEAFLSAGVRAVIGMAGEIEGEAAQTLSTVFYREWLEGEPLDIAMTKARAEVHAAWNAKDARQAFRACLTVAVPPAKWVGWPAVDPTLKKQLKNRELLLIQRTFVDRNQIRADIFDEWLREGDKWLDTPAGGGILVVTGDGKSGKTDAVRLVFKAMLTKGWMARWQEMAVQEQSLVSVVTWLDALQLFTNGTPRCGVLSGAFPAADFAPFQAKIKSGIEPNTESEIDEVFQIWKGCVETVAQRRPVALAFDKLTTAGPLKHTGGGTGLPAYLQHLAERLFRPWFSATERPPPIFAVLVMDEKEDKAYRKLLGDIIGTDIRSVRVADFDPDEASRAIRQYFRTQLADDEYAQRIVPTYAKNVAKVCDLQVQIMETALRDKLQVEILRSEFAKLIDVLEKANWITK